jgi:hypothetical protein
MTDKQKKNNSLLRWEKHNKFTLKYFYVFRY